MPIDWQMAAALLLVAASVAFIARRIARVLRHRSCASGCGGCSANLSASTTPQSFVAVEKLEKGLDAVKLPR